MISKPQKRVSDGISEVGTTVAGAVRRSWLQPAVPLWCVDFLMEVWSVEISTQIWKP